MCAPGGAGGGEWKWNVSPAMSDRRSADAGAVSFDRMFGTDRFFAANGGWFYYARSLDPIGPFGSKEHAERDCRNRYIEKLWVEWSAD